MTCEANGGNLASIHNELETYYLLSLLNDNYWVGLHDINTEGTYEWIDGTPNDFQLWGTNQPNNWNG